LLNKNFISIKYIVIFYDAETTKNKLIPFISKLNISVVYKKIDTDFYADCNFYSVNRHWAFSPAYRFEIFTLSSYNSLLYLDCDTLICGNIGRHPFWTKKKGNCVLRNADIIHEYGLYLPNHYNLIKKDIIFICQKFNEIAIPKFFN
jgi:CDP-6-deoxy-D-xylo-4-hexulose-3-dehydrase